jgi:hypothetical protein
MNEGLAWGMNYRDLGAMTCMILMIIFDTNILVYATASIVDA